MKVQIARQTGIRAALAGNVVRDLGVRHRDLAVHLLLTQTRERQLGACVFREGGPRHALRLDARAIHVERHVVGLREPFEAEVHHVNPSCGDELTLRVHLSEDGATVEDVSYDAEGCSISQASTSVMAEEVIGLPVETAMEKLAAFDEMISSSRYGRKSWAKMWPKLDSADPGGGP